ncbi:hypothetical protein FS749_000156 [Ceratobasidium sp. UAMH 11750]|nr:hypothetical protein FS749_000156 [Ceratobasidium sp. UAMH 11750]
MLLPRIACPQLSPRGRSILGEEGRAVVDPRASFHIRNSPVRQPHKADSPSPSRKKRRPRGKKKSIEPDPRSYIKAFFIKYPEFDYDPLQPVMDEFYRMCDKFWPNREDKDNPKRQEARDGFRDALTQQFNAIYGTNKKSLTAWQNLCDVLQLADIPDNLKECRELVQSTYVNIVDLVDVPVTQIPVEHFGGEQELSDYTKRTGKYFPKENAYAGGLLRFLLRQIDEPGSGRAHSKKRQNTRV